MLIGSKGLPKAFAVRFRSLNLWSVGSQFSIKWGWTQEFIRPVGDVLSRRLEPLEKDFARDSLVNLLTIRFDGSIEPRPSVPMSEIKGKLFRVCPDDIVFSKIDVRNGAIGLVPEGIENACVTSEFPAYYVRLDLADPQYIKILFRTKVFRRILNSMTSGASGRKRIQPKQLENIDVPIPSISIQKEIVKCLRKMEQEYSAKLEMIKKLEHQCHEIIKSYLGIRDSNHKTIGKMFSLHFAETKRWSFEYNERVLSGLAQVRTGSYKAYPLGELCQGQSGSTPSKMNSSYWAEGGIPWASPKDMKTRYISNTQDHISQKAIEQAASPMVKKGSILFVVRSGILQRKVPVAMTLEDISINQDLRAFTPKTDKISSEFLLAYLEAKQDDLLRLVKWSTTVQSINKYELEAFPVPLPPRDVQELIALNIAKLRNNIECLERERSFIHQTYESKIEEMILGILRVECA